MALSRDSILAALANVTTPAGNDLTASDRVRAVSIDDGDVKFVIEGRQQSVKVKYQPPAGGTPLSVI